MTHPTIVVIGKPTVRASETPALEKIGRALAARGKQLITTRSPGVATVVAGAYAAAGGTPEYLTNENYESSVRTLPVIAFTDTKYQASLDEKMPSWRDLDWVVIHNPKAISEAAEFVVQLCHELGTPVPSET